MEKICNYPGCDKVAKNRSLMCSMHRARQKRGKNMDDPIEAKDGRTKLKEYHIWQCMLDRCKNPNNSMYQHYGGRGIIVCEEWKTFVNFYKDMGPRPTSKHQIDRIDNNGNYEPGNCRWATGTTNMRNRRMVKLDMKKAQEIRMLLNDGVRRVTIGALYGIAVGTIAAIAQGRTWLDGKE